MGNTIERLRRLPIGWAFLGLCAAAWIVLLWACWELYTTFKLITGALS